MLEIVDGYYDDLSNKYVLGIDVTSVIVVF